MSKQPYYLAPDCPNCGEKDAPNKWMGGRMGSTAWGHDFMCCSEKCGIEFAGSLKRLKMERESAATKLEMAADNLRRLDARIGAKEQEEKGR